MSSAIRLTRDLDRLQHDPSLTDISARPLPDDIMRWHGNLRWLTGKILHFELVFGLNYPAAPPSIRLFDIIRHFCVDQATGEVSTSFLLDGWSSAYELQSILVTLQSFLCDTSLLHDTHHAGRSIPEVHRDCGCPVIPLCSTPPEPQFVDQHLTTADYALESAARYQPDGLRQLPFDIAIRCCAFLDVHHVRMFSLTGVSCRLVTLVVQQIHEQRRVQKSLVCFHTKVAPEEEPLGICCSVGRHPMSGRLDALTTSMDVLSYSAFKFGAVGQDVMGKSFTHWMPLSGPCFTPALLEEACSKVGAQATSPTNITETSGAVGPLSNCYHKV
jgi:ubiquitin-protein ligase